MLSQRELPVLRLVRLGMTRAGGRGFAARRMRCLRALWQVTRDTRAFSDGGFRFTGKAFAMYGLKMESSFDAAHFLTDYHGKCENLHGHRWRVVAYLEQAELQTEGTHKDMVIDFAEFKHALRDLTEELDHSFVVEEGSLMPETLECLHKEGFTLSMMPFRTTAENLARYFFDKLADKGFPVSQVDVYETPNNCAIYRA